MIPVETVDISRWIGAEEGLSEVKGDYIEELMQFSNKNYGL